MNRMMTFVTFLALANLVAESATHPDDEAAKELKRLEAVWVSSPAKKGRDRAHLFVFQGGRMGWRSFQTLDGEPVIGHAKLYDIRLDVKASPKKITASRADGEDRETLLGIFELEGDKLKIAFSSRDGVQPKGFGDGEAQVITLTKDNKSKVPDLSRAGKRGKETQIHPTAKWFGYVQDRGVAKLCPERPITTGAEFEKLWKALRGKEAAPKVDFGKEFVLVQTSGSSKITEIGLYLVEGKEEAHHSISLEGTGEKTSEGFTYAIGVFRRELVDVVDGRIVAKGKSE